MAAGRVFLVAMCLAMAVSSAAGNNLMNTLNNPKFSILHQAFASTGELPGLMQRAADANDTTFILLAPTDHTITEEFSPEVMECLDNNKETLRQILRYSQIITTKPVATIADLSTAAVERKLWTVLGKPVNVEAQGQGSQLVVILSNDNFEESTVVNELTVTDANVAVVTLDSGLIIASSLREEIDALCSAVEGSAPSSSPSSGGSVASPSKAHGAAASASSRRYLRGN